jgi:ABC-type branched-subunit amino acid transport system ATPase component
VNAEAAAVEVRQGVETSPASGALLEASDVVVAYGGVHAVDGMSIEVHAGQAVGLIGPNGAGKSSLLAALGGQQRVDAGRIVLEGQDITRLPAHRRARLGIVRTFQMSSEFAGMTTFENLVTAGVGVEGASLVNVVFRRRQQRQMDQQVRARAWEVLERFEATHIADLYGRELSGGQRRLVEIMRCLMRYPKVLLLDEPMVGVAPHLVQRLVGDLRSLRDEGIALVVVEHALEVVQELCDHVNVMGLGRLIAAGSYDEVVRDAAVQAAYLG